MAVYGIDLGTTYSAIATLDENRKPVIIENQDDATPTIDSVVYFPEGSSEPVVGKQAKDMAVIEPDRVAQFIKRYIGKENVEEIAKRDGLHAIFDFDGNLENPITISTCILKRIAEYAYNQGEDVHDVVITCPAYFTDDERRATRQAGEIAGLNVLDIINEPTAAALSYCYSRYKEDKRILVYDLGGGTFDVTIVDMQVDDDGNVVVDAIRTGGNNKLGGVDWDNRLYDYLKTEFAAQNGIDISDLDPELFSLIRAKVEPTKITLSRQPARNVTINYNGEPTTIEITKEKFEELTKDLVDQTMKFVDDVLNKAKLTTDDMSEVLLVGGSTLMPMIMDTVKEKFPNSKIIRNDPHLAVVKGAALFADITVKEKYPHLIDEETTDQLHESPINNGAQQVPSGPTTKTVVRLSHSYGPAVVVPFEDGTEKFLIDNLAYIGDKLDVEVSETYRARSSVVEVAFYSNDSERDSEEHYVTPLKDRDGTELWPDPSLNVKYMGSARLENSRIQAGDSITVTITVTNKGSYVTVRHDESGDVDSCEFVSESTFSQEEIEENKDRFSIIKTRGDVNRTEK